MENQWCKYHLSSLESLLDKQKITISVGQETKFIYDIIGYNMFHLGTNQMRRELTVLIKNNLRFCKRKISYSGNTKIDWLKLCLPEKYGLFINAYHPHFSDIDIFGIADENQKNTYVFIFGDINSKSKFMGSATTGNSETTTEELFVDSTSSVLNPLSTKLTKWSNTLKEFVGNLPTNCLSVFCHFMGLALEGLMRDH